MDEEQQPQQSQDEISNDKVDGSQANNPRDSSAGKLFVGGIAWETSEESFADYFGKYGEIIDSVIMMDKMSGRPRGFGFVTFADPAVADKVLEEEHTIDGRTVEVKRTVPREDMQQQQPIKGPSKTKKIFVGGLPESFTEDEMKEYFSSYGEVMELQIMKDHTTGRSRGFGFVTFVNEDAVTKIFSDGQVHELGGKQVEIKKAEPKRVGGDYPYDSRSRYGGGSSKSYGDFGRGAAGYGGGYGGRTGREYGGRGGSDGGYGDYGDYSAYGAYGGNYGGGSAGFYPGYGAYGYGFGFGGPMYGGAGYGGGGYGNPSAYGGGGASYGGGKGYGGGGYGGKGGYDGGKEYGGGGGGGYGGGGSGGYDDSKGYGNGGGSSGRYHPYRK